MNLNAQSSSSIPSKSLLSNAVAKPKKSIGSPVQSSAFDSITNRIGKLRNKMQEDEKKRQKSMDQRAKELKKQMEANKSPADRMRENFAKFTGSSAMNNPAAISSPAPLQIPSTNQNNAKVAFVKYIEKNRKYL